MGVFFELFWLDLIPAGTYIPPNMCLSTVAALSLGRQLGAMRPEDLLIPLLLSIPLALLGAKAEYWHRRWQDRGYNELLHWARRNHPKTDSALWRIVLRSLGQLFLLNFAFFSAAMLVLIPVVEWADRFYGPVIGGIHIHWGHLWLLAAMGGLISLRLRRAYVLLAGAVVLLAAAHLAPVMLS